MCKENTSSENDQQLNEVPETPPATGGEESINEIGSSDGRDEFKDMNS